MAASHLKAEAQPMQSETKWRDATNILCIRLDSLGDVLMTSPAFRALKETQPARRLSLLTSTSGARIASLIEGLDETLVYDPPWMKATPPAGGGHAELQMAEQLKRGRFDAAIIFTAFSQSPLPAALLTFMADIPLRLAYCRENPYQLLTDWIPEVDYVGQTYMRHEVQRQLDLVAAVGSSTADEHIRISVPPDAMAKTRQMLAQVGVDTCKPWLILHPGATAPSRRYPAERFAVVARQLAAQHGFQVVFTGTDPEIELIEDIRQEMHSDSFSLAGQLNVDALAAAISLAPILITNNTGPVHIAAGVQTPVIDLYALTNPQHTPWMLPQRTLSHDVPCKYCYKSICPLGHHHCLALIPPEEVVEAALSLLHEASTAA